MDNFGNHCGSSSWTEGIGLNELLSSTCNIGKIFNLDAITMLDILYQVEKTGELKIIRSAGLDIVRLMNEHDTFQDYVDKYYSSIIN